MAKKNCGCVDNELSDRQKMKEIIAYRESVHFKDPDFEKMNQFHVQDLKKCLSKMK